MLERSEWEFHIWGLSSLCRSGSALSDEGKHHCNPPRQKDRQQPYCKVQKRSVIVPCIFECLLARYKMIEFVFCFFFFRACEARIASRTDELREEDVGTGAGLFEVKKIGDEYFTFVTECKDPKACTILLRGASKEILAVRGDA